MHTISRREALLALALLVPGRTRGIAVQHPQNGNGHADCYRRDLRGVHWGGAVRTAGSERGFTRAGDAGPARSHRHLRADKASVKDLINAVNAAEGPERAASASARKEKPAKVAALGGYRTGAPARPIEDDAKLKDEPAGGALLIISRRSPAITS